MPAFVERAIVALRTFHARYGADVAPVLPRIVVGRARGDQLRDLRERLGREITSLKELPSIPETGVLVERD